MDNTTTDIGIEALLDAKDVKKILKCSLATVYNMVDRDQLPCVSWPSPGKRKQSVIRFKKGDIIDFIESHSRG